MAPLPSAPPEEVLQEPIKDEVYVAWRAATDLREPYRVAPEFLKDTKNEAAYELDETPLIVFINARSGGRVGPELASVLARALGRSQVFDVAHHRPDTVLRQIWANFDEQERLGNQHAAYVRQRLRVLACGGDGTVAWIFKVIHQMNLQPQPPVAIMPLGTGNDLSRSFRWGAEFDWKWIQGHASVYSTLKRVADAQTTDLDCWQLRLRLPHTNYKPGHTYALAEEAAPQQQRQQLSAVTASPLGSQPVVMQGMFWNYFSVGADAQAAYNFHHLRDTHPKLAPNRVANQFWYSAFSCTSGWFCGTVPSVSSFTNVEVLQSGSSSSWSTLQIPSTIKALVLVNLQSYGGGRNIWGASESRKKTWRQPSVSDGLIEVVGFTHGYHAMAVMGSGAKLAHGKRLAQVAGIRLALHTPTPQPDGGPGKVFMQLDGEPWVQPVPAGGSEARVVLEVVHAGVSKVLENRAEPSRHPVQKMTKMLSQEKQQEYLAATADQPTELKHIELPLPLPQRNRVCSDDGSDSAYDPNATPHSMQMPHAFSARAPPSPQHEKASTYGGAFPMQAPEPAVAAGSSCSDPGFGPVADAVSSCANDGRRIMQVDTGAGTAGDLETFHSANSEYQCQVPSAVGTSGKICMAAGGLHYGGVPSAVAVIGKVDGQHMPVKSPSQQHSHSVNGTAVTAVV